MATEDDTRAELSAIAVAFDCLGQRAENVSEGSTRAEFPGSARSTEPQGEPEAKYGTAKIVIPTRLIPMNNKTRRAIA
jgi:hypothetical protein